MSTENSIIKYYKRYSVEMSSMMDEMAQEEWVRDMKDYLTYRGEIYPLVEFLVEHFPRYKIVFYGLALGKNKGEVYAHISEVNLLRRKMVAVGDYGLAKTEDCGESTAGNYGTAVSGHSGISISGEAGTAVAGDAGSVTAGECGRCYVGNFGEVSVGSYGIVNAENACVVEAGEHSLLEVGEYCSVTAGKNSVFKSGRNSVFVFTDNNSVFTIGKSSLEPNVSYLYSANGLVEVAQP